MQDSCDLWLAKKGLGVEDSFLSMFLFLLACWCSWTFCCSYCWLFR